MRKSFVVLAGAALMGALLSSPVLAQKSQRFSIEMKAQEFCQSKPVVWINRNSKSYHTAKSAMYGRTKRGAYMCEADAVSAGYKPVKTERATAF